MGISRDSLHKRRSTGGKKPQWIKKRKHALGRQAAMTKIGQNRVHSVRTRGGNIKFRALRKESGNYAWGSESTTRKSRIIDVMYNASNNELVRTKTLVKGAIIQIDATPFRQWYEAHYGSSIGRKSKAEKEGEDKEPAKQSKHLQRKLAKRREGQQLDPALSEQFNTGRLYARISSRPGQSGRVDGYILEGAELAFYLKKMRSRK
eukprot:NODE_1827_length_725_cov_82.155518_g1777_i0.p1 GENE.NODE_1827_length_725_cov_82.155518_g1777_i0~~NODE_1827_length_725_cov_82.155518_g1777_i0.p1  ORF type:complete len:241 (-),score=53.18 NODE_1827_length_725_cov_82.155518_g1777_i0:1-615(-)